MMQSDRRVFLKQSTQAGAATLALLCGGECWARWDLDAFNHAQADRAMLRLLDGEGALRSDKIKIDVPAHHQNKALVPVAVSTDLPGVEMVSILADSPVDPLVASFRLAKRPVLRISTRIRLEHSSRVWAFVKTESGFVVTNKPVSLVPFKSHVGG